MEKNVAVVLLFIAIVGRKVSGDAIEEADDDTFTTESEYLSFTGKFEDSSASSASSTFQDEITGTPSTHLRFSGSQWITQLFRGAENVFHIDGTSSKKCQEAYQLFTLYLRNQTIWAVRMKESSEWPVVGLLSGKMYHVGDWDECLTAKAPYFSGQYCLIQTLIHIPQLDQYQHRPVEWPLENSSAWDLVQEFANNPFRVDRHIINWALCIPSTCSVSDIKISLDNIVQPVFLKEGLNVTFYEDSFSCSTREHHMQRTLGYYIAYVIFGCIIFLVVTSTIYDAFNNKLVGESACWFPDKLYKCFSARQNFLNLIRFSSLLTTNPGIHLIKAYSAIDLTAVSLTAVDMFFMLNGFLTFQLGYVHTKTFGVGYFFLSVVVKWIRMVPVVILLQLFVIYIFPHLANGPLWNIRVHPTAEMCKASWWTDLLAINNVVNSKRQCLPILWFVAVDIQLSILGGLLLYVVAKNTKIGAAVTIVTYLIFTEIVGILVYRRNYRGVLLVYLKNLESDKETEQFYKLYISPITRVGPYLIGFGAAFLMKFLKDKRCSLSGKVKMVVIATTFIIGRLYIFYEFVLADVTRPYNPIEHAVYSAFKRSFYVLPVACLLCIYFSCGVGKFNFFFEWKPGVAFGRLVYSVYLVHFVFQMFHASSRREYSFDPMIINELWSVSADTVTSFILGFIVYLISEGPINSMSKLLQSYFVRPQVKPVSKNPRQKGYNNKAYANTEVQPNFLEITSC